jgi:hypothetical protein
MKPIEIDEITQYVNENIIDFHDRRISILRNLTLHHLLNKNPYLFRAKNVTKASELIEETMSAFLSSSEEKLFGDFLEDLAIFIAGKTADGHKSSSSGIDLEFSSNDIYYLVSVKSGSNWGNSSQHKKLAQDFRDAVIRLRQSKHVKMVQPILGICYGKSKTTITKDGYLKVVGQNFWTLISGKKELYTQIIEPIGYMAKEYNDNYLMERDKIINLLTRSFIDKFCDATGVIDWPKVIEANSGNYDLDKFITE